MADETITIQDYRWIQGETLGDYGISLSGGSLCNFDERWNPPKLRETFLLLLLDID
jgi:hypothetical protein